MNYDELSADEKKLIDLYRQSDDAGKADLLAAVGDVPESLWLTVFNNFRRRGLTNADACDAMTDFLEEH